MTHTSLREEQRSVTRRRILDALVTLVTERPGEDVSVQEIADAAGVSHRTVYRHFETKEHLRSGLIEWLEEEIGGPGATGMPEDADDILGAVGPTIARFDELGEHMEAVVMMSIARRTMPQRERDRTAAFKAALARDSDHLSPEDAEAAATLVRHLCSPDTWFALCRRDDVPANAAARAVAWAVRSMIEDLRAGGGPGKETT